MKMMFFDLETTGLDDKRCAIHQLSGKILNDNKKVDEFNIKMRPFPNAVIEQEALDVCGVTFEQIIQYQPMEDGFAQLMSILDKHVNKYDKKDKMFMVGYNIAVFDVPFLRRLFILNNNQYFGSYFWSVPIDVIILAQNHLMNERPDMVDFKQGTVAEQLGIKLDKEKLHDAMYDIDVCHKIYSKLKK